jgi:hypothetical protein
MIPFLLWARLGFLAACAVLVASYVWVGRTTDRDR